MSIRKRFDEAQQSIQVGNFESALISLLLCIAAASREKAKVESGDPDFNPRGRDRNLFISYIKSIVPEIVVDHKDGEPERFSNFLYDSVRNPILHEAGMADGVFDENLPEVKITDGKFYFGPTFLQTLSRGLIRDPNLRDQFRDVLPEGLNIVLPINKNEISRQRKKLFGQFGVTYEAIIHEIDLIIAAATPELLASFTHQEMREYFANEVHKKPNVFQVNGGSFAGLKTAVHKGWLDPEKCFFDDDNLPTKFGYSFLIELSKLYHTVDAVPSVSS